MNGPRDEAFERLLDGTASAFERRVLEQALARGPTPELTRRMAQALGVTTMVAPPSAPAVRAPGTPAAAGSSAVSASLAWVGIPAVMLALSAAGLMLGTRGSGAPASVRVAVPPPSAGPVPEPVAVSAVTPSGAAPTARAPALAPARAAAELRGEIDLVDGARAAVAAKAPRRALEILDAYHVRFPRGSFGPEATAMKVEALMQLGRTDAARALARRFVAEHAGTLLGDRVAVIAGLSSR